MKFCNCALVRLRMTAGVLLSDPLTTPVVLGPDVMVSGAPVVQRPKPLISHPPMNRLTKPGELAPNFRPWPNGSGYRKLYAADWRVSNAARNLSSEGFCND